VTADQTAFNTLINNHLNNNTLPSEQHNENGHVINKANK